MIQQSLDTHRTLDMRLLVNSFEDRLQWEEGDAGCHWKDLVQQPGPRTPDVFPAGGDADGAGKPPPAQSCKSAREIVSGTEDRQERRRLWMTRTGKSEQTLYRRIAELKGEGEFSSEN